MGREFTCQGPSVSLTSLLFVRAVGVRRDTVSQSFSWFHSIPKVDLTYPRTPDGELAGCLCFLPCCSMPHWTHLYMYLDSKVAFLLRRFLEMEKYTCIPFIIVHSNISYILWTLKDILNISKQHFKEFFFL